MTASKVRADYEGLQQIAQEFARQSEAIRRTYGAVVQAKDGLQAGDWVGKGADKFYQEMSSSVLPSLKRLAVALGDASQVTLKISQVMKKAEEDAARLFRDDGSDLIVTLTDGVPVNAPGGTPGNGSGGANGGTSTAGAVGGQRQRGSGNPDGGAGTGAKPLVASNYKTLDELKKAITIEYKSGSVVVKHGDYVNELKLSIFTQAEIKEAAGSKSKQIELMNKDSDQAWKLYGYKEELLAIKQMSFVADNPAGTAIGKMSDKMLERLQGYKPASPDEKEAVRNMFLHVTGQSVITTLWGREVADLSGDIHERDQASLITGKFGPGEIKGAVDNYCDMVNNAYGQALGEKLKNQFGITDKTVWNEKLTTDYLNAVQDDLASTSGYKFTPFEQKSEEVKKFTQLLNHVTGHTQK